MTRRLLFVHAHPDDETITTGATMARYAAEGAHVTLVTCTLGEEGEILVPELAQLEAAQADQLGGYRIGELAEAVRHLGVSDHRFLGGAGRFRDSGMIGAEANSHPRAFWRGASDPEVFAAAVAATVQVIRDVRPQVVVTYDDNGDYGHPDHIMAHRVTTAAVERAAAAGYGSGDPWQVAKFYWTAVPKSLVRAGAESADNPFDVADADDGVDDALVTTVIDATPYGPAKIAALNAHRTQIAVDGPFFALSNMLGRLALPVEYFRLRSGTMGSDLDADGRETDLFSGVDT